MNNTSPSKFPTVERVTNAPNAPAAIGPYSQASVFGRFVFLSGQIPLDPKSGALVEGGIEAQTEQVMKNIYAVLSHLGLGFEQIIKTTIFLTDLAHFQTVNGLYEKALGGVKPSRSTIQVAALPKGAMVEIEVIAAQPE